MNLRCLLAFAFSTTLHTMQTEKNVAVPMRDCVVRRADVFWPDEAGSCPMLVLRTSYNKETGKAGCVCEGRLHRAEAGCAGASRLILPVMTQTNTP